MNSKTETSEFYNKIIMKILPDRLFEIWASTELFAVFPFNHDSPGFHFGPYCVFCLFYFLLLVYNGPARLLQTANNVLDG